MLERMQQRYSQTQILSLTPTRFTPMVHGQMVAGAGRHGSALKELISLVISVRPEAKLGELLVYKRGPKYVDFEDMSSVRLSPGERLYFKMNDISGGYKDNSGNIKVQIVCSDCEKIK